MDTRERSSWLAMGLLLASTSALGASPAPASMRVPAANADWHADIRAFAKEHFKNPAWGYSHSSRDYVLPRQLAAKDGVMLDDDVLFAAAYLHDVAAFPPWTDSKKYHVDIGADVVDTLLKGTGFPLAKIDAVRGAIRTHMYSRDPVDPEARYLHDADALDWLGASASPA
jgi:HD superfamily phosphodiesterase